MNQGSLTLEEEEQEMRAGAVSLVRSQVGGASRVHTTPLEITVDSCGMAFSSMLHGPLVHLSSWRMEGRGKDIYEGDPWGIRSGWVCLSVMTTSRGFAHSDASARVSPWPVKNTRGSFSRLHGLFIPGLQVSVSAATGLRTAVLRALPADLRPLWAEGEGRGEKGAAFPVEPYGRQPALTHCPRQSRGLEGEVLLPPSHR